MSVSWNVLLKIALSVFEKAGAIALFFFIVLSAVMVFSLHVYKFSFMQGGNKSPANYNEIISRFNSPVIY